MGFWSFGARKKSRTVDGQDQGHQNLLEEEHITVPVHLTPGAPRDLATMSRTHSKPEHDGKPRRLSKQRNSSQQGSVPRSVTIPASGAANDSRAMRRASDLYSQNPMSHSSLGPEEFTALPQPAPTLLAKPRCYDATNQRRKSSKRKAEDYAREREVRAMSSPDPTPGLKRPTTYSGSGPLRRDTRQVPGKLNRRLQRPASEVSLPLPETIQEADANANQASFKIGIFAALSPRPTLTYVGNARPSLGKQPLRIKPSVQQAIEEEPASSRKRIDELADELDAGGLRELMERDQRRHERKRAAERDRLQRKLQRKADKQRDEELRGRPNQGLSASSLNADARRHGHHSLDGHAESSSAAVQQRTPSQQGRQGAGPFADPQRPTHRTVHAIRNPFDDEKDVDLSRDPFDHDDEEGPPVPVRSPLRTVSPVDAPGRHQPSRAMTFSPPTSPVQRPAERPSFSQTSALAREMTPEILQTKESERRPSDQSSLKMSSWTNFFKRGGQRKGSGVDRGRSTPSEFSNTSRESFVRKQQPPPVVVPRTFRRSDPSSIPQRTMSKFREDLPELPISPPDSRVQSPEATVAPHVGAEPSSGQQPRQSLSGTFDGRSIATSSSNPALDRNAPDSRLGQAMDIDVSSGALSGMVLSQSLASVDSEGSWLSGKPVKRLSGNMSQNVRQSQSSLPPQSIPGAFEMDEDDLADDEYLNRLTPGPSGRRDSMISSGRKASSTIIDLERERQHSPVPDVPPVPMSSPGDEAWHEGVGRQATVVHQPNRAKSTEGLLKQVGSETPRMSRKVSTDDEDDDEVRMYPEGERPEIQESPILRARSVEYKKHGRHASAGSARLLDIRRSSVQLDTAPRSPSLPEIPLPGRGGAAESTKQI
ncbi:uncharacterized protein A1O9_08089 [Exophiala aquamarina CBS 119918]|uniref:Uncharacterized protein n=1 Tax=Exophiala aquamarina CBS 119918 TaxID=1182545 RepID=A0A072P5I5_9EURO|nr:uncharacterized protein A1O9_08089 [Exophiala aquamarina CBS 119918]KEF55339.1 hypothetical protein A1O9_08089 [Exophiala aquamarina CBS 119918]